MEESEEETQKRQEILRIYNSTKEALRLIDDVARDKIDLSSNNQLIKLLPETLGPQVARRPPPLIGNNQQQQRTFSNGFQQPTRVFQTEQPLNRVLPANNSLTPRVLPGAQPPVIPKRPSAGSLLNGNGSFKFNN
jgi:hypothetical protein